MRTGTGLTTACGHMSVKMSRDGLWGYIRGIDMQSKAESWGEWFTGKEVFAVDDYVQFTDEKETTHVSPIVIDQEDKEDGGFLITVGGTTRKVYPRSVRTANAKDKVGEFALRFETLTTTQEGWSVVKIARGENNTVHTVKQTRIGKDLLSDKRGGMLEIFGVFLEAWLHPHKKGDEVILNVSDVSSIRTFECGPGKDFVGTVQSINYRSGSWYAYVVLKIDEDNSGRWRPQESLRIRQTREMPENISIDEYMAREPYTLPEDFFFLAGEEDVINRTVYVKKGDVVKDVLKRNGMEDSDATQCQEVDLSCVIKVKEYIDCTLKDEIVNLELDTAVQFAEYSLEPQTHCPYLVEISVYEMAVVEEQEAVCRVCK